MATVELPYVLSRAVRPGETRDEPEYSVCTLVSDPVQHTAMIASFRAFGFVAPACEFLHLDNSRENLGDGYRGLNLLIDQAEGRHIILVHQDVRLCDGKEVLDSRISELYSHHPDWAVVGNVGFDERRRRILRITDRHIIDAHTSGLPLEVTSLDENLLILRRDALLGFSHDLSGFHLYGTDIVCQAQLRGRRAFVIDFHVEHLGRGNKGTSFAECRTAMIAKYRRAFRSRRITAPSTMMVLGPGKWLQRAWLDVPEYLRTTAVGTLLQDVKRLILKVREQSHGNRYNIDGATIIVPRDTPALIRSALRRGDYQATERRLVQRHLVRGHPVIQLGAGIGTVSQCLRRSMDGTATMIVVETDPVLLEACRANLAHIPSTGPTHLVNASLSFPLDDAASPRTAGDMQPPDGTPSGREGTRRIVPPAVTLAGLLRAFDVRGRFTIVCDIGGAEWDLVANNAPAIAMCETIIVRLDPGALMDRGRQVHEFIDKLAAAGLNPVAREGFVLVAGRRPSETSKTRPTASRGTPGHC